MPAAQLSSLGVACMGGAFGGRMDSCGPMAESLRCPPETHHVVSGSVVCPCEINSNNLKLALGHLTVFQ